MTYKLPPDWQNPKDSDYAEGETLLEALRNGRVFSVIPAAYQPGFLIEEGCDNYFGHVLTPEQLYQLGTELRELALPHWEDTINRPSE